MRTSIFALLVLSTALSLTGCASYAGQRPTEQAMIVNSQGAVSPTARSAMAGSTAPGKQEIIGIYIPLGPNLSLKGGMEWDGTPVVIEIPMAAAPAAASCAPQTVEVEESYQVPETRMVTRTRKVQKVVLPVPQAAPSCAPPQAVPQCVPAPQTAPRGCPEPTACVGDECVPPASTVAGR